MQSIYDMAFRGYAWRGPVGHRGASRTEGARDMHFLIPSFPAAQGGRPGNGGTLRVEVLTMAEQGSRSFSLSV